MIASHVVEVHNWETIFRLGKFILVVVLGYVCLYCCQNGSLVLHLTAFPTIKQLVKHFLFNDSHSQNGL